MTNLSSNSKKWFQNMGSKEIGNVGYREGFSFIGVQGSNEAAFEKRSTDKMEHTSVS